MCKVLHSVKNRSYSRFVHLERQLWQKKILLQLASKLFNLIFIHNAQRNRNVSHYTELRPPNLLSTNFLCSSLPEPSKADSWDSAVIAYETLFEGKKLKPDIHHLTQSVCLSLWLKQNKTGWQIAVESRISGFLHWRCCLCFQKQIDFCFSHRPIFQELTWTLFKPK